MLNLLNNENKNKNQQLNILRNISIIKFNYNKGFFQTYLLTKFERSVLFVQLRVQNLILVCAYTLRIDLTKDTGSSGII